jgi:hypothetical protein
MFRRLPRQIDLDEHLGPGFLLCRRLFEPPQEVEAVDRLDDGKSGGRLTGLVRLKVADEMPPQS